MAPAPAPAPAAAAPAPAPAPAAEIPGDDEGREVITVTGSRIKQKTLSSPAPVAILSREDLKLSGMVSIGDILQNLTAHSNGINVNFNNGGNGATRVNLRGVGSNRTLVLVNGRRFVAGGDGADSSVDLNTIPAAIIERVEVLKDGASAIYGSDAIGGVVNIITRRNFSGVEIGGYFGGAGAGDGGMYDVSLTAGVTSRKGSFMVSAGLYEQKPIWAGDREFAKKDQSYDFDPDFDPASGPRVSDSGSSATPEGTIIDRLETEGNDEWKKIRDNKGTPDDPSDDTGSCTSGFCFNDPSTGWRDFAPTGNFDSGTGDFYNYQPANYLVTPQQRYNLFVLADYELADWARVYVEGSYSRRMSSQRLASEPLFTIVEGITVSADNEHNPFGRDFIDIRRRMIESKNRIFSQEIDTFRLVTGIDGNLPDIGPIVDWKWDLSFNYGRTSGININEGNLILSRVQQALGPADGCTGDCVALDLFGGPGTITQEMLDYITYTGVAHGYTDQKVLNLNTGANLFELWPEHYLGLALGYEYRAESGADTPDPLTSTGNSTGNKREPTSGGYEVHAGFMELRLPVLADMPGVELLELSAAMRVFDYDTFGSDLTYKVGLRWQITDFLAIRGTYSTAFRAPSISELFSGQADSFPAATDPCRTFDTNGDGTVDANEGRTPNAIANCTADGLPDKLTDPNVQIRTRQGGNPPDGINDLRPETAKTLTAGLVLEDKLVKGLSATVDFWSLTIDDSIQARGTGIILAQCYENASGNRQYCDSIQRDANNLITNVFDAQSNAGGVETSGLDFAVRYKNDVGFGDLGIHFEMQYLLDYTETFPDGFKLNGVDVYDLGAFPSVKFNAGIAWGLEGFLAGLNMRYIGGFKECDSAILCRGDHEEGTRVVSRDVDSNINVDFYGSYSFKSGLGSSEIGFGINNIFDQDPSAIYTGFLANSDAATYDYIGRYFYTRLSHKF